MPSRVQILILCAILLCGGCGGEGERGVSPGMTFDPPSSASAIILPPPTGEQQVNQGERPWCAPSAGLTLYRVVTGGDEPLEQVVREMGTNENGTKISGFINWLNGHEMNASSTTIPTTGAVGMIAEQVAFGNYVVPYVNLNGELNSPHILIVYAVDMVEGKIYLSDSNRHLGMNLFALDAEIFRDEWLINTGSEEFPSAFLIFVNRNPVAQSAGNRGKANAAGATEDMGFTSRDSKLTH